MSLTVIEGRAYPLGLANIDTDTIIGSSWLKTVSKSGLGQGAFTALRNKDDSVFADERYLGAEILVAGANFGCGSSREHAAWAMSDMGIRAVLAPSFSDIFSSNAFKNGLLAAAIEPEALDPLLEAARLGELRVDLVNRKVGAPGGRQFNFAIDGFRRRCLLEGLDEVELARAEESYIADHEKSVAVATPWLAAPRKI